MNVRTVKSVLTEINACYSVADYLDYSEYLKDIYLHIKKRVKPYSYLVFSEDLGFSKSNVLRLIIIGQRPLTLKAGEKIAVALNLTGADKKYWISLINYINARKPSEREEHFSLLMKYRAMIKLRSLDQTQLEYFSEWYHPVIREMTALPGFQGKPEWIQKRLTFPLRLEEIKKSLEILEKIGVISVNSETGKFERTDQKIVTDQEIDSLAIIRYHQKMIEIGRESITRVSEDLRDIRAMTGCLPKSAVPILKKKIHQWILEAIELEESKESSEVYQLNIQLFPFTKV